MIISETTVVLKTFLSFYVAFDENITHNMLTLMLDLKYKECIPSKNTIGLKKPRLWWRNMTTRSSFPC
jgi:hypothetical protein